MRSFSPREIKNGLISHIQHPKKRPQFKGALNSQHKPLKNGEISVARLIWERIEVRERGERERGGGKGKRRGG